MISKYINPFIISVLSVYLVGCSSSSGSASAGTDVGISVAPSPAIAAAMPAGAKTFDNDMADTITITKAYLVISSATIETTCGISFTAAFDGMLNLIVPSAYAHTTTTPTSTGEPYVINLLSVDGGLSSIGTLSPPAADYCGVNIDLLAADEDAKNLPVGVSDPDMVGKTLFVEGNYTLSGNSTPDGYISISTGVNLINRELLLSALMMISADNLNESIDIAINYDRWFDAVDMGLLEAGDADELNQVLINVTSSIHQL